MDFEHSPRTQELRARLSALSQVDLQAPEAIGTVIKVVVPNMTQRVVDMAIQLHGNGGAGLSNDLPLAGAWTAARALRQGELALVSVETERRVK